MKAESTGLHKSDSLDRDGAVFLYVLLSNYLGSARHIGHVFFDMRSLLEFLGIFV